MRVYHFTKASHGLSAIRDKRLKVARLDEINDPFEFLGVDLSNQHFRKVLTETKRELSKTKGLLCFCRSWRHPLLWAHYADKHRGVCLGLDVSDSTLEQVRYVNSRFTADGEALSEALVQKLLYTKFAHWSYEDEYRVYVQLDEEEQGLYFVSFGQGMVLREVIVGHECALTRDDIATAFGDHERDVSRFKVRPAFRSFRMVRQKRDRMWA